MKLLWTLLACLGIFLLAVRFGAVKSFAPWWFKLLILGAGVVALVAGVHQMYRH